MESDASLLNEKGQAIVSELQRLALELEQLESVFVGKVFYLRPEDRRLSFLSLGDIDEAHQKFGLLIVLNEHMEIHLQMLKDEVKKAEARIALLSGKPNLN